MNIRLLSDLHLEFGSLEVPVIPGEDKMILVLAGDIAPIKKVHLYKNFVTALSNRHRHTIYIPGNHEFYKGSITNGMNKLQDNLKDIDNISVFDSGTVIIDDVAFVCATLWTDFNKGNPMTILSVSAAMNDYRQIREGTIAEPYKRKLSVHTIRSLHESHKDFMFSEIVKHKKAGLKVVGVSHHAPSIMSINDKYDKTDPINYGFFSHLEHDILDAEPNLWLHGHTHSASDYIFGCTRVVCNPRGYYGHEPTSETGFDSCKIIDV